MKIVSALFISLGLILFSLSCQNQTPDISQETNLAAPIKPTPPKNTTKPAAPEFVDVPELADKPAEKFDELFGRPRETTAITDNPALMPGEYRLYDVAGHPKGLSVRFYRNRAKRFNLLLGTPRESAGDALANIFRIDVSKMQKVRDSGGGDALSEKWRGVSGGVEFETAYAKREKPGGNFTMVHAEVGK